MTPTAASIASWLRASRGRHAWTQDQLLRRMKREVGWAPSRPNYSGYENRGGMKPETLQRFVAFWARHDEPGPSTEEPVPPPDPMVEAIRELTMELRLLREAQEEAPAATAALVGQAIADTLRAVGLADGPRRP